MNRPPEDRKKLEIKFIIVGDSGVGKTMLGKRFTSGVFSDSAVCTVGCEYHAKEVNRKGSTYNVQFWDTAGQEKFGHLSSPYYRSASGCLLVFSLTDARSFQRLNYWLGQLRQNVTNDNFVIVCVGNKSDLGYRDVQKNVIEGFCNREKVTGYVETSAKENINVDEAFEMLIDSVIEINNHVGKNPNHPIPQSNSVSLGNTVRRPPEGADSCCSDQQS
eukprot:TRINITY_DN2788_c0_g1_i6.p2 TRINITY_DN2788_c0_g1~~TRINITY_DN2788_c0_g1_i6.p2  ORF type:complete len:240 (+),score=41.15 TRINITY_DN2788_c0_g1_i6:67-720(+)